MSIQIGDVNLVKSALDTEYRLAVVENLLGWLIDTKQVQITAQNVKDAQQKALETMQKKYPTMGITQHVK